LGYSYWLFFLSVPAGIWYYFEVLYGVFSKGFFSLVVSSNVFFYWTGVDVTYRESFLPFNLGSYLIGSAVYGLSTFFAFANVKLVEFGFGSFGSSTLIETCLSFFFEPSKTRFKGDLESLIVFSCTATYFESFVDLSANFESFYWFAVYYATGGVIGFPPVFVTEIAGGKPITPPIA